MNNHYLIMGQLADFLSGRMLDDTHDERYRQKIARLLVAEKGYPPSEIRAGRTIRIEVEGRTAQVPLTFTVVRDTRTVMLIHYGPGSLTTRHRPALALGRLVARHQVPRVVVTNGETADILAGDTGRLLGHGLGQIPSRRQLQQELADWQWRPVPAARAAMAARIVMAYEVDDRCPCDTDVCVWPAAPKQ